MRKFKKSLMACLIAIFAVSIGLGFGLMPKNYTAKAGVATEYTVVDAPMMGQIQECNSAGGNLNFFITLPGLDNEEEGDGITFDDVDLTTVFNEFGFFDNVMISGKTLRELGCTSFWNNSLGYNIGEPKPRLYLHTHYDPATLAAAMADGTVNINHTEMSTITFKEGTLIPGYRYLKGLDNAVVYRAGCEFETTVDAFAYERKFVGKTDVQTLRYIQDNGNGTGYFGVSLYGDDYLGAGAQEDVVGNNLNGSIQGWYHNDTVLLNGETGKVGNYSLVNLGSKGKGYFAFTARVSKADLTSVTIPAGTKFPMYYYTGAQGSSYSEIGNAGKVVCYFETQTDKTFVKHGDLWIIDAEHEKISTEVVMASPAGSETDYFLNFELSVNDYAGLNTHAGNAITAKEFLTNFNFTSHVLINDQPFPVKAETYLNVWGVANVFSTRGRDGSQGFTNATQIEKITILAGCEFPSYEMLETSVPKYYVTATDVTFVKDAEGVWSKEVVFDLDAYKVEKVAEIDAYKSGADTFLEEQKAQRDTVVANAITAINAATDKETIDSAIANAKAEIDALPLASEILEEQLREAKSAATTELNAYLADGEYTALQSIDRERAVKDGLALIDAAGSESAIADALAQGKALVDASVARVANIVDVTAVVTVYECYKPGGNFYVKVVFDGVDAVAGEQDYDVKVGDVLEALGFWDNVFVGEKSLKDWGVSGGWNNDTAIGYNVGEPQNNVYIHCHSEEWKTSDVTFSGGVVSNYPITVKEGTLVPAQSYFTGEDTYDLYRVQFEMVSSADSIAYGFKGYAETDVVDVQLAQDNGADCYLAVGLSKNDFPSEGEFIEVADRYFGDEYNQVAYWVNVKINGTDSIGKYAIFNLNEGGKGRIALTVKMPYDNVTSITIPAGTIFPTYTLQNLPAINNGNVLVIVFKTTKDVHFVKTASGAWVNLDSYRADALETLEIAKEDRAEADYFAEDFLVITSAYESGKAAIEGAADIAAIDSALSEALTAIQAVTVKAGAIAQAREEITAYKAGLFREAEEAERVAIVEEVSVALDSADSANAVALLIADAKTEIDALKTAAQYADEELAGVKASAREEISNYLDLDNYYADEQAEIVLAIGAGHQGVANAADEAAIAQAVVDAKAQLDEILTKEEVVVAIKADLDAYKAEDGYFRAEEKAQRDGIIANALAELEGLTDKAEIDAIVAEAKEAVDALTTADEHLEAELVELKASAREEIEAYLADEEYLSSQEEARDIVIEDAFAALIEAKSAEAIAQIVTDAKAEIEAIVASVTIVDVPMLVYISDCHADGGNMNMFITIPGLDLPDVPGDGFAFEGYTELELELLFEEFGLYDMVYINDKSLREWGFVGFWNGAVGFNLGPIHPSLYLHMHTDNPAYKEAFASGEISFTKYVDGALSILMSPVTVEKGLLIPGYSYLNGEETSIVYRAIAEFTSQGAPRPYDVEAIAKTTVDSVAYVQEDRSGDTFTGGYFGVSLYGDDFFIAGDDAVEVANYITHYVNYDGILINGEEGHVDKYALYNLGENGKGRFSFAINVADADMYSITIPAGTVFPSYASTALPSVNSNNGVFVLYQISEDVTFVKTSDGAWINLADYVQSAKDIIDELKASKDGIDCFEADAMLIETTVANAMTAIDQATTIAEIDAIVADASAIISAIEAKDVVIANAKADLDAYKLGLLRAEEETQRLAIVAEASVALDQTASSEEVASIVASAKEAIDQLKTNNDYIKEELADEVAEAGADLDAYKAEDGLFRAEEVEERLAIIEDAKAKLSEALSEEEILAIVDDAKAKIDALKTDADYVAEETLGAAREEALQTIKDMKSGLDLTLYTEENIKAISDLYKATKEAIDQATTEAEIAQIVAKYETDLNAIPQGEGEDESDGESNSSEEISGGCFGGIAGASSVFALLGIMAVAVLLKKKR